MTMAGNKEQVRDWIRQRSRDRSPLPAALQAMAPRIAAVADPLP